MVSPHVHLNLDDLFWALLSDPPLSYLMLSYLQPIAKTRTVTMVLYTSGTTTESRAIY